MRFLKAISPYHILIITITICIYTLYPIGRFDVIEWDEARNGVNAYEMLHNHDYFNLYYGGKPDSWNAKPPLLTWCILICYQLFGFNEFALRLPSVLFTIVFFIYYYKLMRLLASETIAFACCVVLLSCKAVLGIHVGITGDFDALLLLFLTASAYHFYRFTIYNKHTDLLLTGLFTGLAFYAKGPAAFLYLPGFALYLTYTGKWATVLKNKYGWIAICVTLAIAGTWIGLQTIYGHTTMPGDTMYGSKNSLEVLFFHDIVRRFGSMDFDHGKYVRDYAFIITNLDIQLNVWNYFLYAVVATGLWLLYKHRQHIKPYLRSQRAVMFCMCMATPILLFLTVSMNQHGWYLAPAWGFVAFIMVKGIVRIGRWWRPFLYIAGICAAALSVRHVLYLYTLPSGIHQQMRQHAQVFSRHEKIIYLGVPYQHVFLYTMWQQKPMIRIDELGSAYRYPGQLLLLDKKALESETSGRIVPIFSIADDYYIAKIK